MALWEAPLIYLAIVLTQSRFSIAPEVWGWTFVAAASQLVSFAAYFFAMSITDASLVLGVTAAYPLITQVLAVVILREELVPARMMGGIAIAIGVFGIGATRSQTAQPMTSAQRLKLLLCIITATCGWGFWGILDKKALAYGSPLDVWFGECVWQLLLIGAVLAVYKVRSKPIELTDKKAWWYVFLSAVSIAFGRFAFLYALTISSASYVITMTGCYPLIMYFFAIVWLKEKFNKVRFLGIMLVVGGGLVVQLTQGK